MPRISDTIELTLSIGKKCQHSSRGWGKSFPHSHLTPGISEFSLVYNNNLETTSDAQPQALNHYLLIIACNCTKQFGTEQGSSFKELGTLTALLL